MSWSDILALPVARADARVAYGPDSARQVGDLRLPPGAGPFPVAVVLHGGCWLSQYGLDQISQPAAALARAGIATWTIEYSRVGDARSGWPGTFTDVAQGVDAVRQLAARYPLDTTRVALAGIPDLAAYAGGNGCGAPVLALMGGTPSEVPGRYHAVSPAARLPIGVPIRLVYGSLDPIVRPAQSSAFAQQAAAAGDRVVVRAVPGAGHFDLIYPAAPAWATVLEAVQAVVPAAGR